MAHALRYFCSWETERYNHQMLLELWEKDYEGEATAMVLSGEPKLTMEEGDTICGSSFDFGLLSETNGQYLHLYTTDNHKYLMKILRDGAVMWEGYLLPEYYSEAYIAAPYTVNFTATDWLGMLKNVDFPAEDTRVPILQIIKTCLQYTELPLDFACQLDMRVEGINDTTNVLGALYLNPITFAGYNCYEVLEKILAAFNATLRQTGHRWLISSIDDDVPLRLISWDSLSYTGDGESNNGELIGTNFAGTFIDGSLAMVISPAKKSVDLSQDIFYRESWLKDYDFHSADAWTWPAHSNIYPPGLAYYIKDGVLLEQISVDYLIANLKDSHELLYLSQVINVEGAPDDSEYTLGIKFFTPYTGDNMTALLVKIINRSSTSLTQDVAYLSKDGWTNEESYIELNGTSAEPKYISTHTYNRGGRQYLIYDKENWPTTKINFISIPYTGTLEIRIELWDSACFGGVYLTKTNITKNLTISSTLNPDAAETASSVNLMLCDSPEERNVELGVLNYFSLSNGALTTGKKWYYNNQEYEDFLHAMAYSYSRCYANKRQKLSGALYTDKIYNLCSFTDKWSGKRHIIKSWIYSIISERLDSMEIIETPAKEIELTLSTPEAGSSNKQNQPSGGTSGGGSTSMAGSGRYVNLDTAQEVSGEKTWNDKATFKKYIVVEGDGIFGGEVSGIVGEGTPVGVTDYSALTGKPSINGKELVSGNNTLDELGIQPKGDYTTASQLATTLDNYATKVFVSNNYATKAAVNTIQALIPATATATNQLADKDFVNSSIATATAEFRGSFTSLDELKATSGNLNDYAFYLHTDDVGNSIVDRYKWTTAGWLYEYTLNNSSFTAEQWAALNSAITATLVQSYNSHLKNLTIHITAEERTAWNNKWDYNEDTIKAVKVNAAVNADNTAKVGGYSVTTNKNTPWGTIPYISKFGVMDVGKSFEFHFDNTTGSEFSTVLVCTGNYDNVVMLPSADGTLALLTDNVASATKLQTPRSIWGRPFDGTTDVSGDLIDVGNISASGKATIQGDIVCGGEVVAVAGEGTPAGVTDYSALTGKPAINGVTLLSGNNTLASLGIQAAGDYATNSGVTTLLANYADKTFVANNYAGKSAFNNHTADTDIHITASERVAWNAKWDYNEATIKAVKVNSASSADSVAWSGVTGKPTTFTPSAHTHTASEVSGLPTSLKNPYALTFGSKTYDGSAAATITASDLGALTSITKSMVEGVLTGEISSHTHSYLPLYGGTITGARNAPLCINGGGAWTGIEYLSNGSKLGYFGIWNDQSPIFVTASLNVYYLIHSGNIGGQSVNYANSAGNADTLDGKHNGEITAAYFAPKILTSANTLDSVSDGVWYYVNEDNPTNSIGNNSALLQISSRWWDRFQLAFPGNNSNILHFRSSTYESESSYSWNPWKTIAFTDSDITGNAASATKLKTPRTIWGRSFDGTGNVDGGITIRRTSDMGSYNEGVRVVGASSEWCGVFLGTADATAGAETTQWNILKTNEDSFRIGRGLSYISFLEINNNGNVLIGTTTDNGYKLQVGGSERVYGDLIVDGEVSALVA